MYRSAPRNLTFNDLDHKTFPNLETASKQALQENCGIIFYMKGYFAVVWFIDSIRYIRDLKGWSAGPEFKPSVGLNTLFPVVSF